MMKPFTMLVHSATLGPIGRLKGAGTVATLLTLPLVWGCSFISEWYACIAVGMCIFSLIIVRFALAAFPGDHDPSSIVLDEVVGCLCTFVGIAVAWHTIIVGFLLFRYLDIVKPMGIKKIEYCIAPWGIILDDVVAGLIANLLLRMLFVWP